VRTPRPALGNSMSGAPERRLRGLGRPLAALALAGFGLAGLGFAAAPEEGNAAAVIKLAEAVRQFNEGGQDEEARAKFADVVRGDAGNGTAQYWLGLTDLRLGRPEEARKEMEKSLRARRPPQVDPLWVLHDVGQAELSSGDAAGAVRTLQDVTSQTAARLEREKAAEPWLRRVHRRALAAQGEALARLGWQDEAAAVKVRERDLEGADAGGGETPPQGMPPEVRRLEARTGAGEQRLAGGDAREAERALDDVAQDAEALLVRQRLDVTLLRRSLLRYAAALERLDRREEAVAARTRAAVLGAEPEPGAAAIVAPPWGGLPAAERASRRWEGRVGVGGVSDSNPGQLSENLSLDTPGTGTKLISGKSTDTASTLDLRLAANPWPDAHGWSLGATFEGRQSFYQDFSSLNLGEARGVVSAVRGSVPAGFLVGPLGPARTSSEERTGVALLLQAGAGHLRLDGSPYLTTGEAAASLAVRERRFAVTQLDLHVIERFFAEEPAVGRLSGTEVRLGLGHTMAFRRDDRYLRIEGLYGLREAGRPFAGSLWRAGAELALPLGDRLALALAAGYQQDRFDHPESDLFFQVFDPFNPDFQPKKDKPQTRRDATRHAVAALTWDTGWRFQVIARLAWIDRTSNLLTATGDPDLDYRRTITSIGLGWSF